MRALFVGLSPRLRRAVLRVVSDADAEDVIQDAFVKLWQHARTHDPGRGSVATWLTHIARNRAVDILRTRRAAASAMARAVDPHASRDPAPTRCDHGALRAALETLPSEERQMLELVYVEELSGPAIAERTGRPLGTVKTVIRRARARLAEALERPRGRAIRIRRRSA